MMACRPAAGMLTDFGFIIGPWKSGNYRGHGEKEFSNACLVPP